MFRHFLILIFLAIASTAFAQKADSIIHLANTFYNKKDFAKAAPLFEKAAEAATIKVSKANYYYYASAVFADAGDVENSIRCIDIAIKKYGYNDDIGLKTDDFITERKDKRWAPLVALIVPAHHSDPLKAKFSDSDVRLFWKADDMAQRDTAHAQHIYQTQYLDKGSNALQDYLVYKIHNVYSFTAVHKKRHKFYKSIRANTLTVLNYKPKFIASFIAFKKIYPQANFPDVHFVVGKGNSAGTSTSNGLILGIDQLCRTKTTNVSEFAPNELHYLAGFDNLPYTVAHEMVHFNQDGLAGDTTLLKEAILEGMADFIGELISGKSSNDRLVTLVKGKERKIWEEFKKNMYFDRKEHWIGNGDEETADRPADLGYWVGYRICKAYYEEMKDKKKAIYNMLHIQDYKKFLEESKLEQKLM